MFLIAITAIVVLVGGLASNRPVPQPQPQPQVQQSVQRIVRTVRRAPAPEPETDMHLYECMNGQVVRYQGISMVLVTGSDGSPIQCPRERSERPTRPERERRTPSILSPELGPDDSCPTGSYDDDGGCTQRAVL